MEDFDNIDDGAMLQELQDIFDFYRTKFGFILQSNKLKIETFFSAPNQIESTHDGNAAYIPINYFVKYECEDLYLALHELRLYLDILLDKIKSFASHWFVDVDIIAEINELFYDTKSSWNSSTIDLVDGWIMEGKTETVSIAQSSKYNSKPELSHIYRAKFLNEKCLLEYSKYIGMFTFVFATAKDETFDPALPMLIERFPYANKIFRSLIDIQNRDDFETPLFFLYFKSIQHPSQDKFKMGGKLNFYCHLTIPWPFIPERRFEAGYIKTKKQFLFFAFGYYLKYLLYIEYTNQYDQGAKDELTKWSETDAYLMDSSPFNVLRKFKPIFELYILTFFKKNFKGDSLTNYPELLNLMIKFPSARFFLTNKELLLTEQDLDDWTVELKTWIRHQK